MPMEGRKIVFYSFLFLGHLTTLAFQQCLCPRLWAPVCGEDGITYDSVCVARCHNIRKD